MWKGSGKDAVDVGFWSTFVPFIINYRPDVGVLAVALSSEEEEYRIQRAR